MPIGAGKLFSGSNANRLRGDGTPTTAFSITSTVPDHRSFRYDISTTYAEGAQLYVLLMFGNQIYPELFGYPFDQVADPGGFPLPIDNYKLSANVTVDANGNASINSSINLHELTNTAGTIAFNSPTQITAVVYQQDSSGPNVGSDSGVTLKKDTQDQLAITNQSGGTLSNIVYELASLSSSEDEWTDWFPSAVDEGWDDTDFTHIKVIEFEGTSSTGGSTGSAKYSVAGGTFNEPYIPGYGGIKDLPIGAVLRAGNRINSDIYYVSPPTDQPMWFTRQFGSQNITCGTHNTNPSSSSLQYRDTSGLQQTITPGGVQVPNYPTPPQVPVSFPINGAETVLWYPQRGPDGEFITANTT
jgi:hypothetical protein